MTRNGLRAQEDSQESGYQNSEQHVYGCFLEQVTGFLCDLDDNVHFKITP